MQLVIAEKPSATHSIVGVLDATEKHDGYLHGDYYILTWCIEYLVSMHEAGSYD